MKNPKFDSLDLISGRTVNPGKCVGYEIIEVVEDANKLDLSICSQTPRYAIMSLEATETTGVALRYLINGSSPNNKEGMPKYDKSVWTIISTEDLVRFRAITEVEGGVILHVEYYA